MKSTKTLFSVLFSALFSFAGSAFAGNIELEPRSDQTCAVLDDNRAVLIVPNDANCLATKARFEGVVQQQSGQAIRTVETERGWSFGRIAFDVVGAFIGAGAGNVAGKALFGKKGGTVGTVVGALGGVALADAMQQGGRGGNAMGALSNMALSIGNGGYGYAGTDVNNLTANQVDALVARKNVQRGHDVFNRCMSQIGHLPGANQRCGQMAY